jgi:hypothetical protein
MSEDLRNFENSFFLIGFHIRFVIKKILDAKLGSICVEWKKSNESITKKAGSASATC